MGNDSYKKDVPTHTGDQQTKQGNSELVCPVCGAPLIQEKCKVVCRSPQCVYRIIYNCSEF